MPLFPIPTPPIDPPAESIARSLLTHANRSLDERAAEHRARFHEFWDGPVPPADVAAGMGDLGAAYIAAATESVRHIATLAAIAGKTLDEVLPPADYAPRLPLVANDDGTLSVGTDEDLDAWGRPIAAQEPEPKPAE